LTIATTVAATPVEAWKPFLTFHTIDRFAPYLSASLVNTRFDFRGKTLQGIQELQPQTFLLGAEVRFSYILTNLGFPNHVGPTPGPQLPRGPLHVPGND
jgi:hypothetical protein